MSHIFDLTESGEAEDYLSFNYVSKAQQQQQQEDDEPPRTRSRSRGRPTIAAPKRTPIRVPDLSFDFPPDLNYDDVPPSSSSYKKIPLKQVQEHQNLTNQLNGYAASIRFKPVIDQCGIKSKTSIPKV